MHREIPDSSLQQVRSCLRRPIVNPRPSTLLLLRPLHLGKELPAVHLEETACCEGALAVLPPVHQFCSRPSAPASPPRPAIPVRPSGPCCTCPPPACGTRPIRPPEASYLRPRPADHAACPRRRPHRYRSRIRRSRLPATPPTRLAVPLVITRS
ncbi:hypothetical protein VTK26DRAFT_2729 [Humicola hyalothermophila]